MAGYTRNDTANNIADGNIINASDLDGEFDAVQGAFDNTTGHTHDGTAGEGAPIEKVGPAQDVVVTTTAMRPKSDNIVDLGTSLLEYKDLFIDGTAHIDILDVDEDASITGTLTVTSTSTLNDDVTFTGALYNAVWDKSADSLAFADNAKATFGASADLQIYHDGSNSIIRDLGTGILAIDTNGSSIDIKASGPTEYMARFIKDGAVSLYYDSVAKLATTSTGISVTGDVDASNDLILSSDSSKITFGVDGDVELTHYHNGGLILDTTGTGDNVFPYFRLRSNEDTIIADEVLGRINFETNSTAGGVSVGTQAAIIIDSTGTYSATVAGARMEFWTTNTAGTLSRAMYIDDDQSIVFPVAANLKIDATNNTLDFPDNFKIMMGASDDLQIYHDGTNSYISDQGAGDLFIRSSNDLWLQNASGTETYARFDEGASTYINYAGSTKLATTATGIDVTGTVTADGLTFNAEGDTITFQTSGTPDARITTGDDIKSNSLQLEADNAVVINSGQDDGGASEVDGTFISRGSTFTKTALFDVNGDISFYEDTGTTPALTWDASAQSLNVDGPITADGLTVEGSDGEIVRITSTVDAVTQQEFGIGFATNPSHTYPATQILTEEFDVSDARAGLNFYTRPNNSDTASVKRLNINSDGDISFYEDTGTTAKFFWDASAESLGIGDAAIIAPVSLETNTSGYAISLEENAGAETWQIGVDVDGDLNFYNSLGSSPAVTFNDLGNVGIGTSSPSNALHVNSGTTNQAALFESSDATVQIAFGDNSTATYFPSLGAVGQDLFLKGGGSASRHMTIDSSGNVGIGTASPTSKLEINDDTDISMNASGTGHLEIDGNGYNFAIALDADAANLYTNSASRDIVFGVDEAEVMRVGNGNTFFGGKSSTAAADYGAAMEKVNSSVQLSIHRQSSDGKYIEFYRGGSSGGGIFADNTYTAYTGGGTGIMMRASDAIPTNGSGVPADNTEDLGDAAYRWDDIFATNPTIQTSDANEKQQIAALTDAEITAAKAISKLFKTFKWNSAVEKKGDAARTHTGVIAQDLEAAMTDAGLDAGNYAFFTKNTWWEIDVDFPAVEADEENNIKAQDAYTRTYKYEVFEEAPEGAVERTRRGVRYPELLAFIGAATEQRLASIESRLDALESA